MRSEEGVVRDLVAAAAEIRVAPREVSRLARCGPDRRWEGAVQAAIAEAGALIEPRGRWAALGADRLDRLFEGATPVEAIARRGERWAFVATIGIALEEKVRAHFDSGHFLEGVLLDAVGSVAAEGLCDLIEERCAGDGASERYSPGYCGWRMEGQRMLFGILHPEEIGIELLPSLLMRPLKSVSGIVVRAAAEDLLVPAAVCEECDAQGCLRRQARPGKDDSPGAA